MPTFIPPYLGEQIKSNAERKMYDVLQQLQLKKCLCSSFTRSSKAQTQDLWRN